MDLPAISKIYVDDERPLTGNKPPIETDFFCASFDGSGRKAARGAAPTVVVVGVCVLPPMEISLMTTLSLPLAEVA
jgi:hypothetical protein